MLEVDIKNSEKDLVLFADNHKLRTVPDGAHEVPIVKQQIHEDEKPAGYIHQREAIAVWSEQKS